MSNVFKDNVITGKELDHVLAVCEGDSDMISFIDKVDLSILSMWFNGLDDKMFLDYSAGHTSGVVGTFFKCTYDLLSTVGA